MRLIECHIDNFGIISDQDISFDKGSNVFLEDNAWGKSTLASFIKVMFYGFDNERKRSEIENERKRYNPWQKGTYGGWVSFEASGKKYIIEKAFGSKNKDDICELRDAESNILIQDIDSNCIGEHFFNVDSESFKRTIFISQNDVKTESTGSISAKIGNITDNTNDLNNYETTVLRLKKKMDSMTPDRKTGSLYKRKEELQNINTELLKEESIDSRLQYLQDEQTSEKKTVADIVHELEGLRKLQKEVSQYETRCEQKKHYNTLNQSYLDKKDAYSSMRESFKSEVPEMVLVDQYVDQAKKQVAFQASAEEYHLSEEELAELDRLQNKYQACTPSEADLVSAKELLDQAEDLKEYVVTHQLTKEEQEEFNRLHKYFSNNVPSEETIKEKISAWNKRTDMKSALSTKKVAVEMAKQSAPKQHESNNSLLFIIIGLLCIVAGIGIAIAIKVIVGLIPILIGIIIMAAALLQSRKPVEYSDKETGQSYIELLNELEEEEKYISEIETDIKLFFEDNHLRYREDKVVDSLYTLIQLTQRYSVLLKKRQNQETVEKAKTYKNNIQMVRSFLENNNITPQNDDNRLDDDLQLLKEDMSKMQMLQEKRQRNTSAQTKSEEITSSIQEFLSNTGLIFVKESLLEQLIELKEYISNLSQAEKDVEQARNNIKEYESNTPDLEEILTLEQPDTTYSLEQINALIDNKSREADNLRDSIAIRKTQLDESMEEFSIIQDKKIELEEKQQQFEEELQYYQELSLAKKMIEKAKEALTAKFSDPIKKAFDHYYYSISGLNSDDLNIDANGVVTAREYGIQRNVETLSVGYQDLIGMCLRMAFVDSMYENEKPFLIFDDPFVNLDSKKIEGAKRFMKELEKQYQLIYFTCHESRVYN